MSSAPVLSSFDPDRDDWLPKGGPSLAKQIFQAGEFLRALRVQLRFGELTRAPLQLIRFEILTGIVECDWLARMPDPWDKDLARNVRERHRSLQTLKDAIDVRALLFDVLPQTETAHLRVYRPTPTLDRELILAGCVHRNDQSSRTVHSLAMRAKVLGFRFSLEGDSLRSISMDGQAPSEN